MLWTYILKNLYNTTVGILPLKRISSGSKYKRYLLVTSQYTVLLNNSRNTSLIFSTCRLNFYIDCLYRLVATLLYLTAI